MAAISKIAEEQQSKNFENFNPALYYFVYTNTLSKPSPTLLNIVQSLEA